MSASGNTLSVMDLTSKSMDLTARAIDLLVTVVELANAGKSVAYFAREILRWLGKEGLHENELAFFLSRSQSLVMPNGGRKVVLKFFQAVTGDSSSSGISSATPAMAPLCAQPFASIGKLVARDPTQRWMISTICCLLLEMTDRYHDESYIKAFLTWFLIMGGREDRKGRVRLSKYDMSRMPERFRLEAVVKKVVESAWLHIANAGLLGTEAECPRLPLPEFDWTCKNGHNLDDYQFAKLTYEISQSTARGGELIIQSQYLLTDVVLWLLWHHHGRFRVVVSSKVVYDNITSLGPDFESLRIVECRVTKACDKEGRCHDSGARKEKLFQVFEHIAGNLNLLFKAAYNGPETGRNGIFVRQELYEWPHRYPKDERQTREKTARVAQDLLRWYLELPLPSIPPPRNFLTGPVFQLRLGERHHKGHDDDIPTLKVGDLLGRSPMFLNENRGNSSDTSKVVFSMPREEPDQVTSRSLQTIEPGYQNYIISFFPILQDLVEDLKKQCLCLHCYKSTQKTSRTPSKSGGSRISNSTPVLHYDKNCLSYLGFHEVLFYFSHAIADSFGAPDASGTTSFVDALDGDLGALDILYEALTINEVSTRQSDGTVVRESRGKVEWSTLFRTAVRVFLGGEAGDLLEREEELAARLGGSKNPNDLRDPWNLRGSPIIAAQYGALAVVAPWIDISQHLSRKRSFRFDIVQGKLGLYRGPDEMNDAQHIHEMVSSNDLCVVMTPRTEDVSEFSAKAARKVHEAGAVLTFGRDQSEEKWNWVLVPVDETKKMLLLRVVSGQHSRMVDPSNALCQLLSSFDLPLCTHRELPVNSNVVPENCQVELHDFDQLLGHWGDEDSDSDTEYDSSHQDFSGSDDDEDGNHNDASDGNDDEMELDGDDIDQTHPEDDESSNHNSPEALPHSSSTSRRRTKEVPEKYKIPASEASRLRALSRMFHFRASQTLTSVFKFNTALAISHDFPCFVAPDGKSCLECALETAVEARRVLGDGSRRFYIVKKGERLATTVPLLLQDRMAITTTTRNRSGIGSATRRLAQ